MSDKEVKLNYLKVCFRGTLEKCEGGAYDRKLFIAMYENLVSAVEEFYSLNVESSIIHVGFNNVYNEKFNELKDLETSLKERNMV
ncbi:hypothetical protein [Paenibacillus thiaminolyticus]|uniref:hypothetical protein n=1 Tax=Paenibacillus thiaminolyticus TaxID=49283 RepID=UPI0025430C8D|nr:hypothetical protein [Paenibacillus thiaminolyticus]WII39505.1 hypothetical protein O0V01_10605 [Paenibacillus thiaminolyticus]